jgi:hypothetical protein
MFSGKEYYMHAHCEMLPIWTLSSCLGQPRQNHSALWTQCSQMLGLCIHVAEMALGQHWQRFVHATFFACFSNSHLAAQTKYPLHRFHQNKYHHKSFGKEFLLMTTRRLLLAMAVVWVLYESATKLLLSLPTLFVFCNCDLNGHSMNLSIAIVCFACVPMLLTMPCRLDELESIHI